MAMLHILLLVVATVVVGCGRNQPSQPITSRDTWTVLTRADCATDGGSVAFVMSDGRRGFWSRAEGKVRWMQSQANEFSGVQALPKGAGLTTVTLIRNGTAGVRSSKRDGILHQEILIPAGGYAARLIGSQWCVVLSETADSAHSTSNDDYLDSYFQADVWKLEGSRYKWLFTAQDGDKPLNIIALAPISPDSCVLLCQRKEPPSENTSRYELRELDLRNQFYLKTEALEPKRDTSAPFALATSRSGRYLAVARRREIDLFDGPSFTYFRSIRVNDDLGDHDCVALSDDGRWLAIGNDSARVFALETGKPLAIDAPNHKHFETLNQLDHQRIAPMTNDVYWQGALRSALSVAQLQFVKGDSELIVVTHTGQVNVWKTDTWNQLSSQRLFKPGVIEQVFGEE